MIVPHLSDKIKNSFSLYCQDYSDSHCNNLAEHKRDPEGFGFFRTVYPLFVLMESLKNSDYFVDPSQEILLREAIAKKDEKDEKDIAEIARKLGVKNDETDFIKEGVMKRHFTPYFNELSSDMLMLLNNYYSNNYRGCYISLRCALEDLYRHLYYKDHAEEFHALMNGSSEYGLKLNPEFFREYLGRTSFLKQLKEVNTKFEKKKPVKGEESGKNGEEKPHQDEGNKPEKDKKKESGGNEENKFGGEEDKKNGKNEGGKYDGIGDMNLFDMNESLYKKTSAYVHASHPEHMSQFEYNSMLAFGKENPEKIKRRKEIEQISKEFIMVSVSFLILAHLEYFIRFNDYEKSIILDEAFEYKMPSKKESSGIIRTIKHNFREYFNI
ncbi:MAG: hypothetical protein GY862_32135 [Gammaproteobacteria bacterium]|nr:hypothetical protein [Gammaproteobacteria bacterium]